MKKLYFLAIASMMVFSAMAENIVNGGFESWVITPTIRPSNWKTSNATSTDTTVRADTDRHAGNFSARITVVTAGFMPSMNTTETTGALDTVNAPYQYLNFWYKTNLISGDALKITCSVYKSDGTSLVGQIVSPGYVYLSTNTSSWTPISIAINYFSSPAARVNITFTIEHPGGGNTNVGSYARVDDVTMSDTYIGINDIEETSKLEVYPNPVRDFLNFRTPAAKSMQVKLSDALGNVVLQRITSEPMNGYIQESLDLQSLSSGVYFLMLTSDKKTILRRVIVD
jgi:hypothetical protein